MKLQHLILGLAASGLLTAASAPAHAQQPYIGEVRLFAMNFCPTGWMAANGQLLPIRQYTPLFSLLGTYYGGDGRSTFALPNLMGRVPAGASAYAPLGMPYNLAPPTAPGAPARPAAPNALAMTWCVAYLGVFPPRN